MRGTRTLASLLAALLGPGCVEALDARPQLLVTVDTDAHLVGELAARPEVSPDAAIDTLRVDVLGAADTDQATRTFDVHSKNRWPISFGVANERRTSRVRLRLRLFRARDALREGAELTPFPETSVDRLVEVELPQHGVERVRVTLSFDCLGRAVDPPGDGETCVDRDRLNVPPDSGVVRVDADDARPTMAGTWPDALEMPCAGPDDPAKICIPGGFSILGDRYAVGESEMWKERPAPPRPVVLSPFRMDRFEYTVGRFRALSGFNGMRPTSSADAPACFWHGQDDAEHDAWPLNCTLYESAALACALEGGSLPSEAQWEHAARGRGEGRLYPWGDDRPRAANGRSLSQAYCTSEIQPVDTQASARCYGTDDISRDGVQDLAGNLSEAVGDKYASYDDGEKRCWNEPIARDPLCTNDEIQLYSRRGGSRREPLTRALSVLRGSYFADIDRGFRCVYAEETP